MRNWIIVALITLLFMGFASATFVESHFERGLNVPTIRNFSGQYTNSCATFMWARDETADLSHFVVVTESNVAKFNSLDFNTTNSWYTACTIAPGDWVRAYVYRIDENTDGYFLNMHPDVNAVVNPGTSSQAGIYLLYNILAALGAVASLLILAIVLAMIFKHTGFRFKF